MLFDCRVLFDLTETDYNIKYTIVLYKKMVSICSSQPLHVLPKYETEPDNGIQLMWDESNRLRTFNNWPVPFISKKSLAESGFYYIGPEDHVRCAFCYVEIGSWEEGDDADMEHKRWSPRCPFVKRQIQSATVNTSSVPLDPQGYDTCGFSTQSNGRPPIEMSILSCLGVETINGDTKYSSFEKRLESFKNWPVSLKQKPNDLASAGFYYTGTGDQTICFKCSVGLKDWEENDDVWEEHALWSPECTHLISNKGLEFVSKISKKYPAVLKRTDLDTQACSSLNINICKPSCEENCTEENKPTSTETQAPTKECNKEGTNPLLCGICYDKERSIIYLPCRHMFACEDCGSSAKKCPICRQEVKAFVKAYIS